ncbi:MAG: hypothetical protein JRI55_29225 [Deltaproteobacteria bacterium]|nr:hypothetical protein [Deltaproteobacteria bacterium]
MALLLVLVSFGAAAGKAPLALKGFDRIEILHKGKVKLVIHRGGKVEMVGRKDHGQLHADGRFVGPRGKMAVRLLPDGALAVTQGDKSRRLPLAIDPRGKLRSTGKNKMPPLFIGDNGSLEGGPKKAKGMQSIKVRGASNDAARRAAMLVLASLLVPMELVAPNAAPPPARRKSTK